MSKFLGTGVAVVTPFNKDKSVDYNSLTNIINYLIDQGVDYLVCQGSTGEKATLTKEEQIAIAKHFVEINQNRVPLVLGVSDNNTFRIVDELKQLDLTGFDAILSANPSYNKPSQEGLYCHFKAIAEASNVPLILYNIPSRTGVNMLPKTVLRLAKDFDNIIAIKEASGSMKQALELIRTVPKDFLVLSGEDVLALSMTLAGGSGVISVAAQGLPKQFSQMIKLGLAREVEKAFDIQYKIMPCIDYLFQEGNPSGIKSMLSLQGLCKNELRLPLMPVSNSLENQIKQFV